MTLSGPLFVLAVLIAAQATARIAPIQWLVIAGSADTVTAALNLQQALKPLWPEAKIIATSDCYNLRPRLYVVAAAVVEDRDSALAGARKLQAKVAGAYPRMCIVKVNSRIALGIPLVDGSEVPQFLTANQRKPKFYNRLRGL